MAVAALMLCASTALAGSKPSDESCAGLGNIDITCSVCETGEYIGKVTMPGEYSEKHNSCLRDHNEARSRCARAYGYDKSEIGVEWSYWIGLTRYDGHSPPHCQY